MSKSKVVCPKCKSKDLTLIEIWNGANITWQQTNGEFDKASGEQEYGDPVKVEARCSKCDHAWTLRGISQIDYIIID